jgi:hypothetical protein
VKLLAKLLILVVLIAAVLIHHAVVHFGVLYDNQNIFSHEAVEAFLIGMVVSLVLWGRRE